MLERIEGKEHILSVIKLIQTEYKFVLIDGYNLLFRTRKQEEQYQEICCRIMNAKTHFVNAKTTMSSLKAEKPKIVRNFN